LVTKLVVQHLLYGTISVIYVEAADGKEFIKTSGGKQHATF